MLAQMGIGFSWEPFAIIAAFGLSYAASLVCGIVGIVCLASRDPRLELMALWVSISGVLVMCAWFAAVLYWMPLLLALNVLATTVASAPLILCAIAVRFAIVRRWTAKHDQPSQWTWPGGAVLLNRERGRRPAG